MGEAQQADQPKQTQNSKRTDGGQASDEVDPMLLQVFETRSGIQETDREF